MQRRQQQQRQQSCSPRPTALVSLAERSISCLSRACSSAGTSQPFSACRGGVHTPALRCSAAAQRRYERLHTDRPCEPPRAPFFCRPSGPESGAAAAGTSLVASLAVAAEGLPGDRWAEQAGSEGRMRCSFDQVNRVAAVRAEEPWAAVAGSDGSGRRSFDQVNRVAAAVAAEKARRRSLQRQLQEAAAARPRSHAALHTLPQQVAPTSAELARAQPSLLGRQRSASEGQLEALLGVGCQVLAPPPATPRPANEATTVARRLGALSPDPASTHAPLTASPAVQPASKAGSPRPGSAAQPAAAPVLRSSAPPEASAPRQLLTHVAGSSSINGRGGSPRVHLRGSQLWPEGPGRGGDQEVPPPFSPDPGLHTGLSTSRGSAAAQAGLRTSPRGSTRTAGGGQNGRLAQPAAAAPPSRLFIHAVSSPFPTDEADGKSAAQHAARHAPSSPGSATSRQVAQEGQAEGPGTPWRRVGLLSAAARLLRP